MYVYICSGAAKQAIDEIGNRKNKQKSVNNELNYSSKRNTMRSISNSGKTISRLNSTETDQEEALGHVQQDVHVHVQVPQSKVNSKEPNLEHKQTAQMIEQVMQDIDNGDNRDNGDNKNSDHDDTSDDDDSESDAFIANSNQLASPHLAKGGAAASSSSIVSQGYTKEDKDTALRYLSSVLDDISDSSDDDDEQHVQEKNEQGQHVSNLMNRTKSQGL